MINELQNKIEAILFASGEPIEPEKIAEALEQDCDTTIKVLGSLKDKLDRENRPIELLLLDGKYQLSTRTEYAGVIKKALEVRRNMPLSQAALEVLAIIAYNQPVTRSFVEQIRGVDSSGIVSSLVEKGLVDEAGRLELPGRPIAYCTSTNFLRCFGMRTLEELPQVEISELEDEMPSENVLEGQIGFDEAEF